MKSTKSIFLIFGAGAFLAAPLQAQFAPFEPDSSALFHTTAGPDNSSENTGVSISGKFEWQSDLLRLRVHVENESTSGVMIGFGFDAPGTALTLAGTTLFHFSVGDFEIALPYDISPAQYTKPVGAFAVNPGPSNGLQVGQSGFFDFQFLASDFLDSSNFSLEGFLDAGFGTSFRFQSIDGPGAGSDKFTGIVFRETGTPVTPVPEPSTYGLAGLGLLALLIAARRVRSSKKA